MWHFKVNFLIFLSPFPQIEPVTSCPKLSRHMEQLSTIPFRVFVIFKGLQLEPHKHFWLFDWVGFFFPPKSRKHSYLGLSSQFKNWILYFSSSKNFKLIEMVILHLNLQCSSTGVLHGTCPLCCGITLLTHFYLWATVIPDCFNHTSSYPVIPILCLGIWFLL